MDNTLQKAAPSQEQKEAIEQTEGACMVLAGPGSGKTFVVTHRIAHLLTKPAIRPWNILALTFTNKAAREMKERIEKLIGDSARHLWIGTFHSLFARMLRIEAETIGLERDFTIYDSEDSKKLIKKIIKELSLSDDIYKPNIVLNRISGAKNRLLLNAKGYEENFTCRAEDEEIGKKHMAQIFVQYESRCRRAGALDFDDILLLTYQMLRDYPEIAAKYQERFHYILVDEFQDTNKLQYALLKKLATVHQNLCVIGDDAQSIYAFRGADLTHMLNFRKDFPQMHEIKLTRNFRSTQHIVKAANTLIKKNQSQLEKVLFTDNELGEPIWAIQHQSDLEEARYVARNIFETSQREKITYNHFAILYRTNRQSRLFEEALRKVGIPYRIRGATSFYSRKEIKDMLSYLRLLVNPNDEQALERVINTPKRGIGTATFEKIRKFALEHDLTLFQTLEKSHEIVNPRLANAILPFTTLLKKYQAKLSTEDAYTIAKGLATESGLLKSLYDEKSIESMSRYENLEELLSGINSFVESREEEKSLSNYLQEVALMTEGEEEEGKPYVTMMTIHAAKGLEYGHIYVVGLEEGILPSPRMTDQRKGVEEERRLFYVALTRAKKRVVLNYATMRKVFESYKRVMVSRFLKEIDPSLIQHTRHVSEVVQENYPRKSHRRQSITPKTSPPPIPPRKSLVRLSKHTSRSFDSSKMSTEKIDFKVGIEVMHPRFGQGKIVEVSNTAHGARLKVAFSDEGEKTLLASFAKLTLV